MDGKRQDGLDVSLSFPIVIRTYNRPVFLSATLASLSTFSPDKDMILIFDDGSEDPDSLKLYETSDSFALNDSCVWPTDPEWQASVGVLDDRYELSGIRGEWQVYRAPRRLGAAKSVFASVEMAMRKWPEAEAVLHIEADILFCGGWIAALNKTYQAAMDYPGRRLGVLGMFNPWSKLRYHRGSKPEWGWLSGGKCWTSQMLLFTRSFYDECRPAFDKEYRVRLKSADHRVSEAVIHSDFMRASSKTSYCQHIGFRSICWKDKRILAYKLVGLPTIPPGWGRSPKI